MMRTCSRERSDLMWVSAKEIPPSIEASVGVPVLREEDERIYGCTIKFGE